MEEEETKNTTFSISDLMVLPERKESKFKYEFQELCSELEPIYGKLIWTLPYKKGFSESKIRRAHEIAKARGITKIPYLIGIMKRDPGF